MAMGAAMGCILGQAPIFWTWIALAVLDIASGLMNAVFITKNLSSDSARRGCVKKAQMLIIWLSAVAIEKSFHLNFDFPYLGPTTPSNFIAGMWAMTELISAVENAGVGGAKLPRWVEVSFQKLKAGVDSGPSKLFDAQDKPITPEAAVPILDVKITTIEEKP